MSRPPGLVATKPDTPMDFCYETPWCGVGCGQLYYQPWLSLTPAMYCGGEGGEMPRPELLCPHLEESEEMGH